VVVDVTRIPGLNIIEMDEAGWIHLGALVTHNDCVGSEILRAYAHPLAQAAWEVGAPQIRNRGTVAGNLITASPANDTITPLVAMGARVTLRSLNCERVVPLEEFYTGVRGTVNQRGTFIKLALRRAQAISVVNAAVLLTFSQDPTNMLIEDPAITLGAVAPTIIHARRAEMYLQKRQLNDATIAQAADLAMGDAHPIDDLRSSAAYRREMVRVCVSRSLHAIAVGEERVEFPDDPVLLNTRAEKDDFLSLKQGAVHLSGTPIVTRINGKEYIFNAGLIGTKEGCAEGECGACTIFMDGVAVMSCLVPAVRAHGAEIITIEGLMLDGHLHPVQQAFVEEGAVQCGYCTPGFIMSGVKLLEEQPNPTKEQIQTAITGNLCRCTGYYKIVQAIEKASVIGTQKIADDGK
jgi:carbon-monoxide dehydrogenase medium subunit